MEDLIVHKINIAHYRLVELSKLAEQAKPFYDWIERKAKGFLSSHHTLNDILMSSSRNEINGIILSCYKDTNESKPLLFDGIGRTYPHLKACFYFFAWIIRDAPQQRLSPLISRMQRADDVKKITAEIDSLAALIFEYRDVVKSFEWQAIKEIIIDRLEGSRRSISAHFIEANVRTGLVTAIQSYFAVNNNYGIFKKVDIEGTQIKVGRHTIDISAKLTLNKNNSPIYLHIPVKTRETEGGGHSHLFTRDLASAISDISSEDPTCHFAVIIIAENWSPIELKSIENNIDIVFHFNINPNTFVGFDDKAQIKFNQYIKRLFNGE
jgi:hypothetical protein